jgi:guanylate kinase
MATKRPPPKAPRLWGQAVVITIVGPSGSGKSTATQVLRKAGYIGTLYQANLEGTY